ncbi:hypothetical protein CC2G_006204 [Coprinopsis cinerea AmutBmut pab1-1]|nr:hypothetical protein CC2G_006204 [Coprinopsis cinerea AmutBmut pab1-1]
MRQVREATLQQHLASKKGGKLEPYSLVKSVATTFLVVYGGEAITGPMLGFTPSFMLSGAVPALYATVQAIVDNLPAVPAPSADLELPLSVLDGITRAYLLCNLIPPTVTANASPSISTSPWTLLITSLLTANAGFFFVNLFSFFNPTSLSIQTPPELLPYGWSTADLWCAPATTALYALLTHAQPFWGDLHTLFFQLANGSDFAQKRPEPLDPEVARAICAVLLSGLFIGRAAKNFGLWNPKLPAVAVSPSEKKVKEKAQ